LPVLSPNSPEPEVDNLPRALVFNPDILLLDEPLAALGRKLREAVRQEIHQLQRNLGITTIMVTHDQDEALSLSDRILILNHGCVEQYDTLAAMYRQPWTRFVAGFLGTANFVEDRLEETLERANLRLDGGIAIPCPAPVPGGTDRRHCAMSRPDAIRPRIAEGLATEAPRGVEGPCFTVHARGEAAVLAVGAPVAIDWDPGSLWQLPEAAPAAARPL
jgi:ABC-type Fe3+/spermidine/putrescine transport system ATPase subunit